MAVPARSGSMCGMVKNPLQMSAPHYVLSHHTKKDMSVRDVVTNGIATGLQRRLSNQAALELELVQGILGSLQLQAVPDQRETPFSKRNSSLDSSAIYTLLKARGQPGDERASFIWHSVAPPRVQMFMWLLMKEKIQCRTVLHQKHVLPDSTCEVCGREDEDPEHVIRGCTLASDFWTKRWGSARCSPPVLPTCIPSDP